MSEFAPKGHKEPPTFRVRRVRGRRGECSLVGLTLPGRLLCSTLDVLDVLLFMLRVGRLVCLSACLAMSVFPSVLIFSREALRPRRCCFYILTWQICIACCLAFPHERERKSQREGQSGTETIASKTLTWFNVL